MISVSGLNLDSVTWCLTPSVTRKCDYGRVAIAEDYFGLCIRCGKEGIARDFWSTNDEP